MLPLSRKELCDFLVPKHVLRCPGPGSFGTWGDVKTLPEEVLRCAKWHFWMSDRTPRFWHILAVGDTGRYDLRGWFQLPWH